MRRRDFLSRLTTTGALAPLAPLAARFTALASSARRYPEISWNYLNEDVAVAVGYGKELIIDGVVMAKLPASAPASSTLIRQLVAAREALARAAGATWTYAR